VSGRRRARVRVRGRVQGVFFRDSLRRAAAEVGVAGYARNLADGSVEAAFEGAPASVQRLVDFAHVGPPDAEVREVEVAEEPPEGVRGFFVD
jgi:acylphosphatase